MMRAWIQRYLGIEQVMLSNVMLTSQINELKYQLSNLHDRLSVTDRGIGRVIAKVDPDFGRSEFSAERKAESDRIGAEVMRKLIGEYLASKNPIDD